MTVFFINNETMNFFRSKPEKQFLRERIEYLEEELESLKKRKQEEINKCNKFWKGKMKQMQSKGGYRFLLPA